MDFKDKINDAIKEENLDYIAELSKAEKDRDWLEHGGPFGRPVFPNIEGNSNGNGNGNGNSESKSKSTKYKSKTKPKPQSNNNEGKEKRKRPINKFSGNGRFRTS